MREEEDSVLLEKKRRLWACLSSYETLAVAFSGGVDSTLLLASAQQVMGGTVLAMTAQSPTHPAGETASAIQLARRIGVRHLLFETNEIDTPAFVRNGPDRCYHCKKILFTAMRQRAAAENIGILAHGANIDDLSDYRPGFQAAQEAGVQAPLIDAGLTKADIRRLARQMALPNWNRPAMACLATRMPYGMTIDVETLNRIATAEALLGDLGVSSCRIRHHGTLARIEVGEEELQYLMQDDRRRQIVGALRSLGYAYVTLDLEGYVSGKMNRDMPSLKNQ